MEANAERRSRGQCCPRPLHGGLMLRHPARLNIRDSPSRCEHQQGRSTLHCRLVMGRRSGVLKELLPVMNCRGLDRPRSLARGWLAAAGLLQSLRQARPFQLESGFRLSSPGYRTVRQSNPAVRPKRPKCRDFCPACGGLATGVLLWSQKDARSS